MCPCEYMKKYLSIIILSFSVLLSYSFWAGATSKDDIVFPVAELGGCEDQEECRDYCNEPENIAACVSFAEQHNLMSKDEAERARRFASVGNIGPGGCNSKETCEAYCENIDNIEVCLRFAEDNHMLPDEELQEARNVHRILKEGKKFPGDCRGKSQCTAYCENPDHMEECIAFGEESGLMSPEELEKAKKFIPLMKRGETPGGCRTKEQCEEYCLQEDHIDRCAEFALEIGAATKEEMEMFKKTRGRGPGGCRGREECEGFCNDPANQEACFKFAEEHGFIEKGQREEIRGHQERLKNEFGNFPPEVLECIKSRMGTEVVEKIRAGTLTPGPEIGEHLRACFENFRPQMEGQHQGMPPMEGGFREGGQPMMGKPGGCSTPEECTRYCSDPAHKEECGGFMPHQDMLPQGEFSKPFPSEYQRPPETLYSPYPMPTHDVNYDGSQTYPTSYPTSSPYPTTFEKPSSCVACASPPQGCYYEGSSCESCGRIMCPEKTYQPSPYLSPFPYPSPYEQQYQQPSASPLPTGETMPQSYYPQKNKYMATILQFLIRVLR